MVYHIMMTFDASKEKAFLKYCGKKKNANNQHFSPFTTMFSILSKRNGMWETMKLWHENALDLRGTLFKFVE